MNDWYRRVLGILNDKVFIGPERVYIYLTDRCNYHCFFCRFHGKYARRRDKLLSISFKTFKNIIDDCLELNVREVIFTGKGEPFLHPFVYDMIDYVKKNGIKLGITTNGTFDRKKLKYLAKVDYFQINISAGTEHTYAKLQCSLVNSFRRAINNVKILERIRRINGYPKIKIIYVVNRFNYLEIDKTIRLMEELRVDGMEFRFMTALSRMKKIIMCGDSASELNYLLEKINKSGLPLLQKSNINDLYTITLETIASKYKIKKATRLKEDDRDTIIYYNRDFRKDFQCYIGWYEAVIETTGDVFFCCNYSHLSGGNIQKKSFKKIWFSEKLAAIRNKMKYLIDTESLYWQRCHSCTSFKFLSSMNEYFDFVKKYPKYPLLKSWSLFKSQCKF